MVDFNVATTKKEGEQIFSPSAFVALLLDPGPGIDKSQDPRSEINIPDPRHW
jgi:hypothetical protein